MHKLMMAFGREAYRHSVFPQQSPFIKTSKNEGYIGRSEYAIFAPATLTLTRRGWTQAELTPLFQALEVGAVTEAQPILLKGRVIEFVVFVLRGSVSHGAKTYKPGQVVGAAYAVSGMPVLDEAVSESSDGILGCLYMARY